MSMAQKTWQEQMTENESADGSDLADESERIGEAEEKVYVASYAKLMWWRFLRHKAAVVSAVIILLLYLVVVFAEFVAPYMPDTTFVRYKLAPPTIPHIIKPDGGLTRPFIYKENREVDPETLRSVYVEDQSVMFPIYFFVEGPEYDFWGLFVTNIHLFGIDAPIEEQGVFLLGADRLGRDMFSRICYGTRISLTIGLVSVGISLVLGIVLGGMSGFYGGTIDNVIQRVIEFIRSIPEIPLIMALGAAMPATLDVQTLYFAITIVLALVGWTGLARVVRGRFLSLREEDFVMAARLCGSGEMRIILRHMMPSFLSHIIAALSLAIPAIILAETGLSFIGLGLRAPAISWGVLLQEGQNVRSVALAPWVLSPAFAVIITVLAFNFLGDGIRDAADPYAK